MNERQTETTVELSIKLTREEIALLRVALSQSATEHDWKEATAVLLRSLRARRSRYLVRQLGSESPKWTTPPSKA